MVKGAPTRRRLPLRWRTQVLGTLKGWLPPLRAPQRVNLALLVSASLQRRSCHLTELARSFPPPRGRRVPQPKHDPLHRLKRLWRFLNNLRLAPAACQVAAIPSLVARLGSPRRLPLALDWTYLGIATALEPEPG
jgi:hypothetical protein